MIHSMSVRNSPPALGFSSRLRAILSLLAVLIQPAVAQRPAEPTFEAHIVPILESNCTVCHGEGSPQAGLDVRTRQDLLEGGNSGPALVPGIPVDSLLLQKVASGAMPMGDARLPDGDVDLIRRWIEAGAPVEGESSGQPHGASPSDASPREILVTTINVKCLLCHGRRRQEGGLDLRTRESTLRGGVSGPALLPGDPEGSLLIRRIVAEEMPPEKDQARLSYRPVTSQELESLRQ